MSLRVARTPRRQSIDPPAPHHEATQPARTPISALALRRPAVQAKLAVNQPDDLFEREAEAVATAVVQSPTPAPPPEEERGSITGVQRQIAPEEEALQRQATPEEEIQRQSLPEEETVQRQAEPEEKLQRQTAPEEETLERQPLPGEETAQRQGQHQPSVSPATAATIRSPGSGRPLPAEARRRIEPHLGANLSGVRLHTGPRANRAAGSLQARAFTYRHHIFLNRAESSRDTRLLAHEATHVVQQGAAVQRLPQPGLAPPPLQRMPAFIADELASYARHIPGYTLFTVIIGFNPLTGSRVERTAMNLVEGVMGLVPFGTAIFDKLRELEILQQAFGFIDEQLTRFDLSLSRLERLLEEAYEEMDFLRLDPFDYNLGVLTRKFSDLLNDVRQFAESLVTAVVEMIKEAAIGLAEDLLAENRAWALIKKILKYDPLRDEPVEATTVEILEDFLLLIGKEQELDQMRQRGTLAETAAWLETQFALFVSLLAELRGLIGAAWEAIQPENLPNLMTNLQSLAVQAGGFLQRVWDFATTVAAQVLALIKNALLSWLSDFAHQVPGFHLVTVLLGRNPFTNEPVPRTAENIIRGFITLLPGGNEKYEQLQQTGTIAQAAQRIEGAMESLGISWDFIVGLFTGIWESLSIQDLIDPIGAFQRIVDQFGEPIGRLFAFIQVVLREIMTLVLELMNFPTDLITSIIANAMQAYEDIKRDPVQFFLNLLGAVKEGFSRFFDNILQHLLSGLTNWLFGQLRDAGIQPPTELTLASVLDLVLQILGISMERIWQKLAERIGQENVDRLRGAIDRLTGIWNFVRDVQERGVAVIWEYIQAQISNLWDMVLEQARNWIVTRIIERVVTRLLSMLDPTGIMAVINGFMAFFNAVQSAIQYLREMLEIVNSFVTTVAEIARGSLGRAAQFLENTLAQSLPVAIGFLANQVGLGNLGERIQEIIADIRGLIDRALDWLLDRAVSVGQSFLSMLGLGGGAESAVAFQDEGIEFNADREDHRLWIEVQGDTPVVLIASGQPTQVATLLDHLEGRLEELAPDAQNRARTYIRNARQRLEGLPLREVRNVVRRTQGSTEPVQRQQNVPTAQEVLTETRPAEQRLADNLRALFQLFCGLRPFEGGGSRAMATSVTLTVRVSATEPVLTTVPRPVAGQTQAVPLGVREDLGLRRGRTTPYWQLRSEERLDTGREPGSIAGGRLRQPAPVAAGQATAQVQVLSWATGSGDLNSNISHAEHQFVVWFEQQPEEWRNRVTRIDVRNNPYSPCSACAGELATLRANHPHIEVAFLTWQTPWDAGLLETKAQDLNRMIQENWVVHPGPEGLRRAGGSPC